MLSRLPWTTTNRRIVYNQHNLCTPAPSHDGLWALDVYHFLRGAPLYVNGRKSCHRTAVKALCLDRWLHRALHDAGIFTTIDDLLSKTSFHCRSELTSGFGARPLYF